MRYSRLLALFVATATMAIPLCAQVTGLYPFGPFDTPGFDTINRGNLNIHLTIPIFSKPGRGGSNFVYYLNYDGLIWQPVTTNGSTAWSPAPEWGWTDVSNALYGYVTYSYQLGSCWVYEDDGKIRVEDFYPIYSNYQYHDNHGNLHPIGYSFNAGCGGSGEPSGTGAYSSTDDSGLTFYRDNNVFTVFTQQGSQMTVTSYGTFGNYTLQSGAGGATFIDTNGNEISAGSSGFTDTMGYTPVTISGGAPNPVVYIYKDSNNNSQTVTVNYTTYSVQTAFGVPNISEYSNSSVPLVSSIVYSGDSSSYTFSYECTPGYSGSGCPVTGRIAGITLRTGGTISYTYTGGYNGIESDGTVAGLTRALTYNGTTIGSSTYVRSNISSTASTTTYTDAANNQTVSQFLINPTGYFYETDHATYQGSASGTALRDVQTCYNTAAGSCSGNSVASQISSLGITTLQNGAIIDSHYQEYAGSLIELDDNNDLDLTTAYSYDQFTGPDDIPFVRPGEITTTFHSDTVSSTSYAYDQTTPVATSGLPQHIAVSTERGNLTSVISCCYTGGGSYTTTFTTDDAGQRLTSMFNGATTTYSYDSATDTLLTGETLPSVNGVALSSSYQFDPNTGVPISVQGPNTNNPPTAETYDGMMRPTQITFPDGGKTEYSYPSTTQTSTHQYQNASTYADTELISDAFGRPIRVAVANGQGTNPWYQQDSCYDTNGNLQFISYRYQGTGPGSAEVCSGNGDTYSHDALGRALSVTHADGTSVSYVYNGNAEEVTDENGVSRIADTLAPGVLNSVCEISSNSSMPDSGSPASCGMSISGTGFLTSYSYSFGEGETTTTVTQGDQTRTFQTDGLGRPIMTQEPESGQTTWSYTYNSTGLLVTRTRPEANQTISSVTATTSYQSDALGRLASVSYSDGTPTQTYLYDTAPSGWSISPTNLKGMLALAETGSGSMQTGDAFSYDPMGRVLNIWECTPLTCGGQYQTSRAVSYNYDWTGNVTLEGDPASGQIQYQRSVAGEVTQMTNDSYTLQDSTGTATLLSNVVNGPDGPTSWQLGNGLTGVRQYNSNGTASGGWLCRGSAAPGCSGGSEIHGWTLNVVGGRVNGYCDYGLPECANIGYDDLGQMTSMTSTGYNDENLSWTYDRWGNRWDQTVTAGSGPQPEFSFNVADNQINTGGYSYDAAGNLTSDGVHAYKYDANGNIVAIDNGSTATYIYDALNNRAEITVDGGSPVDAIFDAAGQITSNWSSPTASTESQIFWGDSQPAFRSGDGNTYFKETDWEATDRVHTDYSGNVGATFTSLPFGDNGISTDYEPYADWDFDNYADVAFEGWSGTDEATFRRYSPGAGRWMSPDPYSGSYDFTNPQSLNRYAYVQNQPLSAIDPEGLAEPGGGGGSDCNMNPGGCPAGYSGGGDGGGGGAAAAILDWADAEQFEAWLLMGYVDGAYIASTYQTSVTIQGQSIYFPAQTEFIFFGQYYPVDTVYIAGTVGGGAPKNSLLHRAVCGAFSWLTNSASASNSTIGIGAGGNAGVGFILGIAASGGVQIVADSSGNLGVAFTVGGNPGYGVFGVGAMGGVQGSVSTANTIYGLRGGSFDAGVSFGAGPAVTLDGSAAMDGSAYTGTVTVGPGVGTKATALGIDYTWVPSALSTNCH